LIDDPPARSWCARAPGPSTWARSAATTPSRRVAASAARCGATPARTRITYRTSRRPTARSATPTSWPRCGPHPGSRASATSPFYCGNRLAREPGPVPRLAAGLAAGLALRPRLVRVGQDSRHPVETGPRVSEPSPPVSPTRASSRSSWARCSCASPLRASRAAASRASRVAFARRFRTIRLETASSAAWCRMWILMKPRKNSRALLSCWVMAAFPGPFTPRGQREGDSVSLSPPSATVSLLRADHGQSAPVQSTVRARAHRV
jgi:hypothetical protein